MTSKLKRLLLPLLRAAAKGGVITFRMRSDAQQALFLVGKATSKSKGGRLRREAKAEKRLSLTVATSQIREACVDRAGPECEASIWRGGGHGMPRVMDHWSGGSGRRVQKQSIATCWMLCIFCNGDRTANYPNAEFWNEIRRQHCEKYGYPFTPHITHAQLKRSAP